MKPIVRLAENSDGAAIKALLIAAGPFDDTISFDDIHPFWIVADLRGVIVGCIQTCPSRPIGQLEMLATADELSERERTIVVRELLVGGLSCMKIHRAEVVAGFVPFELKAYKRFLKRRGGVVADSGNIIMWRAGLPVTKHQYKDSVVQPKESHHAARAYHSG